MKKRKLILVAALGAMSLSLAACQKTDGGDVVVVSSSADSAESTNTDASVNTAVSADTTVSEGTAETDFEVEDAGDVEITGEEMGSGSEESDETDAEKVIAAKEEAGYDADSLIEGTKVGISGSNVYIMVDGKGLLFDFDGYGIPFKEEVDGALVGANAYHAPEGSTVRFVAYQGGVSECYKGHRIDDMKVGEETLECYWDPESYVFVGYCKDIDASLEVWGALSVESSDEMLSTILAVVDSDLKYFDATQSNGGE